MNTATQGCTRNVIAYREIKEYCDQEGLRSENTSVISLLLPPGNEMMEDEVLELGHKLLKPTGKKYVLCAEPVMEDLTIYKRAGYYMTDDLPLYHLHVIIEEEGIELRALRKEWYRLVGRSRKRLFHCSHVRDTLNTVINYLVKYLEDKRPGTMTHDYSHSERTGVQIEIELEPTNSKECEIEGGDIQKINIVKCHFITAINLPRRFFTGIRQNIVGFIKRLLTIKKLE